MSKVKIDFSKLDDGSIYLIPEGIYKVEIVSVELNGNTGNQYPLWKFRIIAGEYENRRLSLVTSLQQKNLWYLRRFLCVLGDDSKGEVELNLDSYTGKTLHVVCENHFHKGKWYNKVSDFFSY